MSLKFCILYQRYAVSKISPCSNGLLGNYVSILTLAFFLFTDQILRQFLSGVKIFVINLKRSKDRRILIKKELDRLGMPFSFFNAIDGRLIKPSYQKEMMKLRFEAYRNIENLKSKITVSHGQVGCALSHIKIYSHIVKKRIPLTLVLEDDSEINED